MKKLLLSVMILIGSVKFVNSQTITTIAGTGVNANAGDGGLATAASLNTPYDVAVDAAGNRYVTCTLGNTVRKINAITGIITTICGTGVAGSAGDGGLATAAQLNWPMGVAVDNSNNIYISEFGGQRIRKINAGTGIITTIIGTGVAGYNGNGLLGTATQVNQPCGIAVDGSGNVHYVDYTNQRIRKLTVSNNSVTTIAGTGTPGWTGDGGLATAATINAPYDVCLDNSGNIYWGEMSNHVVRKVLVGTGIISTIAGTGVAGYNGDGILATSAQLNQPTSVFVDQNNNVYISTATGQRIRKITAIGGLISTICGSGAAGFSGDGGLAIAAVVNQPFGITGNNVTGDLFFVDNVNYRVRKINNALLCGVPAAPTNITLPAQQNICSGNSTTLTATSGGTVNWYATPVSTLVLATGNSFTTPTLSVGTYTYYAEATTCTVNPVRTPITITVNALPVINVNSGSMCSGYSFTMVPSGANTYTFQGGSSVVSPTANSSYTVIGTSSAGCVSPAFATSNITVLVSPTITVNSGSICSGNSFTMFPSGAFTYTYQGGNAVVSPTSNTSYTVIGTNTLGCVSPLAAISNITVYATPTIAVNSGSICAGNSFTMFPSGAFFYTFQGGSAVVSPTANSAYTVTGTSTAGCVSQGFATSFITVNAVPSLTVNSGSICYGQSFTMVPGGANSYTFQGGSPVVTPTASTSYTVIGTSSLGCVSQSFVTSNIVVNAIPTIAVNSGSICLGNSFTMNPTGAFTYTFQGGNAVVNPTTNTSYTVVGTSSAGCVSAGFATAFVTVAVGLLPTITVNSGTICAGQSFTMIPSGAFFYTFQGGSAIVSPTTNATYTVIGTNTAGCTSASFATSFITVNPAPSILVTGNSSICVGETATLIASGASSYSWNAIASNSSIVVSPTTTTTYTASGISVLNGCSGSTVVTLIVSPCIGLAENNLAIYRMLIYPNPNNGSFIIKSDPTAIGLETQLTITNGLGQVVNEISLSDKNNYQVSVINLAGGIYFLSGISNGNVIKQKIIISN